MVEIITTIMGLIQGGLVWANKRSNWIFYCLQYIFLGIFSYTAHLYGDVTNSLFYFCVGITGWILWDNRKKEKTIKECSNVERIIYSIGIAISTFIVYFLLKKTNDPLPFLDAITTTTSYVATYYMVTKKVDTWLLWLLNDILYVIEYWLLPDQALYLMLLNLVWTFMAIGSFISWNKAAKKGKTKKVYFAGKFNIVKNKSISLEERLKNDYRSKILGNSKKLTNSVDNLLLNKNIIYSGPFYCEQASNGDFTSTDCNVVINAEYKAVKNCDIFFAVFDESFSVGTVVELDWALKLNKDIILFYKEEQSSYTIKSEYWFSIANALKNSKKIKVFKYKNINEIVNKVKKGKMFYEV